MGAKQKILLTLKITEIKRLPLIVIEIGLYPLLVGVGHDDE